MLALQSTSTRTDSVYEGPSPLVMLLDAKCDPNTLGISQQSPLLYAVGLQNNDAVEDILIARADANHAPTGFEPPLCVAIRHRMGEIAKTLLTYMADVTVRGHFSPGSGEDGSLGPTVTDLASEDRALLLLLRAHQSLHTAHCDIVRRPTKPFCLYHKYHFSLERSGLLILLGDGMSCKGQIVTIGLQVGSIGQ